MTDSEKIKSLEVQLLAAGKVLERIDRNHCDCIYKPGSGKTHNDWCVKYIAQQALTPDIQKLLKEDAYRRNQIEFWKGSSEGFEKISLRMSSENADLRKQLDEKDARIKELATQRDGLVGALEIIKHAGYPKYPNVATPYELQKIAIEALSTLPSAFLEFEKAKDAVIEAAEYLVWPPKTASISELCPECGTYGYGELRDAFKTLRTLQQAQEKK